MRKYSQLKYKMGATRPECLVYNKRLTEVPSVARGFFLAYVTPGYSRVPSENASKFGLAV